MDIYIYKCAFLWPLGISGVMILITGHYKVIKRLGKGGLPGSRAADGIAPSVCYRY